LDASSQEDPPQQQFAPEGAGAGGVGAGGVGTGAGGVGAGGVGAGGVGAGGVGAGVAHLSWQPCTQAANTAGFVGQSAMHADKEPPGQSPDGDGDGGLGGDGGEGVGVGTSGCVEPRSPNLMLEYFAKALLYLFLRSSGFPLSMEQGPRSAPGAVESVGKVESNHNISVLWSSQIDSTNVMPRPMASPICFIPPFAAKSFGSPKTDFCAAHVSSVREL